MRYRSIHTVEQPRGYTHDDMRASFLSGAPEGTRVKITRHSKHGPLGVTIEFSAATDALAKQHTELVCGMNLALLAATGLAAFNLLVLAGAAAAEILARDDDLGPYLTLPAAAIHGKAVGGRRAGRGRRLRPEGQRARRCPRSAARSRAASRNDAAARWPSPPTKPASSSAFSTAPRDRPCARPGLKPTVRSIVRKSPGATVSRASPPWTIGRAKAGCFTRKIDRPLARF